MKILQIINSLGTGGAEKLLLDTLPLYRKAGVEMDILLLWDSDLPFTKALKQVGCCKIHILKKSGNYKHIYNPLSVFKIRKILKDYDIAHVHLFPAQYFTVFANLLNGNRAKLVFTEHSTANKRTNNSKIKFIEKYIYSNYKQIICITSGVKNVLNKKLDINDEKLLIIQNGINIEQITLASKSQRVDFGLNKAMKILIMVAGFREQKDQDTVIKALQELPDQYILLLVGDGKRRVILEKLVNELALNNRVYFLGIRSDVYSIIKMADIAVLSSHWEGFGLVAAEAMACGIPLLASNVDGLAQVVAGAGILFPIGNEVKLVEEIMKLLQDKEYYNQIAQLGKHRAAEYDISKMVEKHIQLYKEIYKNDINRI